MRNYRYKGRTFKSHKALKTFKARCAGLAKGRATLARLAKAGSDPRAETAGAKKTENFVLNTSREEHLNAIAKHVQAIGLKTAKDVIDALRQGGLNLVGLLDPKWGKEN